MPRRIENQLRVRAVGSKGGSVSFVESGALGGLFPSGVAIVNIEL